MKPAPLPDLAVQRPISLKVQSYQQIRGLLTSGHLVHDRLYSANQLAEQLQVSRTPVREALLQLEAEGLLVQRDGRGFQPRRHTRKEAQDFFETRLLIELHALTGMAAKVSMADLVGMGAQLTAMREAARADDRAAFMRADEAFHLVIIEGCGNRLLASLWCNIRDLIAVFGRQAIMRDERMDDAIAEHEAVLEALRQRDPTAASGALKRHLDETQARLLESFLADGTH
jgi:DNA-binding GntR family transcriptional regulator